jgi:hypothetical protein
MQTTHKYTTRVDANSKETVLMKDGKDVNCHRLAPMFGQDALGRPVPFRLPCGTLCGRANVCKDANTMVYQQTCESIAVEFNLEAPAEETKKSATILNL